MKLRLFTTYLLNLFDLAMTTHWVNLYGLEVEGNPVGRWLYKSGIVYPAKIVGVGLLLWLLYEAAAKIDTPKYKWWDLTSWAVLAVYGFVAVYHIILAIKVFTIR